MRLATRVLCLLLAGAALLLPAGASAVRSAPAAQAATAKFRVLVLTEGNAAADQYTVIARLARTSDAFDVVQVRNSANGFTARHLSRYNAVVFLNTTGTRSTRPSRTPSRRSSMPAAGSSASGP